jgi:hypothetical protein
VYSNDFFVAVSNIQHQETSEGKACLLDQSRTSDNEREAFESGSYH